MLAAAPHALSEDDSAMGIRSWFEELDRIKDKFRRKAFLIRCASPLHEPSSFTHAVAPARGLIKHAGPHATQDARMHAHPDSRSFQEHQETKSVSGAELARTLGAFDLVVLGIGCTVGAGIVVLTGLAANQYAGPGVVLSYVFAAVGAMLTAFCYSEYAAEFPVTGGAFK